MSDGGCGSEAQMDELQRMYDMRTWDMYIRITEARKNMPAPTMIPHQQQQPPLLKPAARGDDYDYFTPGDESFEDSDHHLADAEVMIFGDLE